MRKVFDKLHHHGKKVYKHAQKHHKKYFWGAAGFFGIFKLFSFLIVSIFSYTTIINASLQSPISVAIPATTIDIQEGKSIIQFDLSDVDLGNYSDIQNIDLRMNIETQKQTIDMETLRNSTTTSIGKQDITNLISLQLWKTAEKIRTVNIEQLPQIIQQLLTGNTVIYFLPQENINIQSGTIFMELEVGETTPTKQSQTGNGEDGNSEFITGNLQPETGDLQPETGDLQPETGDLKYEIMQKNINTKKDKTIINNAKTLKNIALESKDKKIHIKIPKDTKIHNKDGTDFEGTIQEPQKLNVEEIEFDPKEKAIYAFEVGDPQQSIMFKNQKQQSQYLEIKVYLDDERIQSGKQVMVYYSEDKTTRNTMGSYTIQADEQGFFVNIISDHMTTFLIGETSFEFFIGDSGCKPIVDIADTDKIYACITGDPNALKLIKSMQFSNISQEDLEKQVWLEYRTPYDIILPKETRGNVTLRARYAYDKDKKIRGTTSDTYTITKRLGFNSFIGNSKGNELAEIENTQTYVYMREKAQDPKKITQARYSINNKKEILNQSRNEYIDKQTIDISGVEGTTTIYTQYMYTPDGKLYYPGEIISDTINIKKIEETSSILNDGSTIPQDDKLTIDNIYRTVTSSLGSVTIDSKASTTNIHVSNQDWNGTLYAPTTAEGDQIAVQGEAGLPYNFEPSQTIVVGANNGASLTLDNEKYFTVSFTVNDTSLRDQTIDIYYSQDGATRNGGLSCTVTTQGICTFQTDHLTLFTIGATAAVYMTGNNLNFLNQNFWNQNPTSGQIIDAIFGTGGAPSAYTTHRSDLGTGCRASIPSTGIVIWSQGTRGATTLAANTIYILNSGNYLQTGKITFGGNCIAFIGSGTVTITKQATSLELLYANTKTGTIIDNIQINGSGDNQPVVSMLFTENSTINDIQLYNNTTRGLRSWTAKNILINNSQFFNNPSQGYGSIYIYKTTRATINNVQSYNNGAYGIYINETTSGVINNTQVYNNSSYGIRGNNATGLIINNTQVYNNSYGIYLVNSRNVRINNTKVFKNAIAQYGLSTSSGLYYGTNVAYPTPNTGSLYPGSANPAGLGRSAGTMNITDPGFTCDFVTEPYNGFGTGLYAATDCSNIGNISRNYKDIVKYYYGNDMTNNQYVLRQIQPVSIPVGGSVPALSDIPYHGHRFIGEYDDPNGRDINNPVMIFTGSTPPQGTNIISGAYSGSFTIQTYIYEPNPRYMVRRENFPGGTTTYPMYDSGLIFMVNFDNIAEIGESTSLIKDLSIYKKYGTIYDNVTWTGNGKRNGGYIFPTSPGTGSIVFDVPSTTDPLNPDYISIFARVKPKSSSQNKNIVGRINQPYRVRLEGTSNKLTRTYINTASYDGIPGSSSLYAPNDQRSFVGFAYDGIGFTYYLNTGQGLVIQNVGLGAFGGIMDKTTNALYVGAYTNTSENSASMIMDEIRIYNRKLTTGEVVHLYNSNLAAKPNYREYTTNYTGVQSWPFGTYTYGFNTSYPMIDSDSNTGVATGYVVKHLNCGTGFTITRNNNNLINSGFRNQNPTDCDIIYALYGTGTTGQDPTAYTDNRTGRANQCSYQNMSIVYLTGGTDKIPQLLTDHTIYVLSSGTYIQTNTTPSIEMNTCTTIIGKTGNIMIYSNNRATNIIYNEANMTILDNIQINGTENGGGGNHAPNGVGVFYNAGTINNTFNTIIVQKNITQGMFFRGSNYNKIINTNIYANSGYGIYYLGNDNILENSKIYNTTGIGIYFGGSRNVLSGIQIFANTSYGINIQGLLTATINNIQVYNNTGAGIYINTINTNIVFNNLQSFNNGYGIQSADAGDKKYITLNNSQIYNNSGDGVLLYRSSYFTINNTHVYNNGNNGIYFAGSNNNSGILNNSFIYNNANNGVISAGGTHKYYGLIRLFDNSSNSLPLTAGGGTDYSSLGWTAGVYSNTGCINCSRVANPLDMTVGNLINTTTYPKCNMRGTTTWTGGSGLAYTYGINLTGQKQPVYRNSTTLSLSALGYSGAQYVAETNKLGTYTNTTCSCLGNSFRWNNDSFINSGFWNNNPNYCDIIAALYGTGLNGADRTAYTYARTGYTGPRNNECNIENMDVIYITGGTGKIAYDTTPNTIYILSSGNYIQTGSIGLDQCTAIIGVSTGTSQKIILYSTGTLANMISTYTYSIIDNIFINGTGGGVVPPHTANGKGINLGQHSSTINNTSIYNNSVGLEFFSTKYNQISNSKIYNNAGNGVFMYAHSKNNIFNNMHIYNNGINGIYAINNSENLGINNSQIYNNGGRGIYIHSTNNAINNSHIYNNAQEGIYIGNFGTNTKINKSSIYNNNTGIYIEVGATNSKYYGDLRLFDNTQGNIGGTPTNLTTGSASDYPGFGRTNGNFLDTGTLTRDYFSNPQNTNAFLLSFTGYNFDNLIGIQMFATTEPIIYSYGTGISTQIQPVYLNGTTLQTGGIFNGANFIGGNTQKITGDLLGVPTITSSSGLTVMGTSSSPLVTRYAVRGNIANIYSNMNLGTSTGIFLDDSVFGTKRIVTFLYKQPNSDGFLTHFEKQTTFLIDPCLSGWNNDNFIDNTFRAQSPSDANIICALYGIGPGDKTAYTELRTGRDTTQCSGIQMNVIYTGILPSTLATNTIYVMTGGSSTRSATVNMANCSTVISNQTTGTTFYSTVALGRMFLISAINYSILDNIHINGSSGFTNTYGVQFVAAAKDNTLHNINIYNNSSWGVYIYGAPNKYYSILDNVNIYNNAEGMFINDAENTIINDTKVFNNNGRGIVIFSAKNTVNNSQSFNNASYGIRFNVSNNILNNSISFNNGNDGIRFSSTGILNNVSSYNNSGYGIYAGLASSKYYGTNYIFNNINNSTSNFSSGSSSDLPLGRSDGLLNTTTMSRDYITNPINNNGNYLLPWTGTWAGIKGTKSFDEILPITYSYGSGILTQIQPVYYSGTTLKTGGIFDINKYIGSDVTMITGNAAVETTSITGSAYNNSLITHFSVFGDITTFKIGQTIDTNTGINMVTGLVTNRIITQLFSSQYFATHFQTDHQIPHPIIYFTGSTPADGATISTSYFTTEMEMITTGGMNTFIYTFSGINYPYYDSGLLLMMNFDNVVGLGETTGVIVKDRSQHGNHGTGYGGITRTGDGKRGGAYRFNGTDDYIEGYRNHTGYAFTIGGWVKYSTSQVNPGFISFTDSNGRRRDVYILNNTAIRVFTFNGTNAYYYVTPTFAGLNNNQRHFIMARYDGTNPPQVFVDGTRYTGGSPAGASTYPANKIKIGALNVSPMASSYYFNGLIDEPRIRNRALSSGEIAHMYYSNLSKYDTESRYFTTLQTGLLNNVTYGYTGTVSNLYGISESTGRTINIDRCGNGTEDPGEECDDGNTSNTDACTNACMDAICGDTYIRSGQEECDDGGTISYDGCSASCETEDLGTLACTNGDFDLGSTGVSASIQQLSSQTDNDFKCVDLSGATDGTYQVQMGDELTNGLTTINSGSILLDPLSTLYYDCTGGVTTLSGSMDTIVDLMQKDVPNNLCTFQTTPTLFVTIPSRSTPGTYSGTLIITYPN